MEDRRPRLSTCLLAMFGLPACTEPAPLMGDGASSSGTSTMPDVSTTPDVPTTTQDDPSTTGSGAGGSTAESTGDPSPEDMPPAPACGDGELDDGEQCDDGVEGNADTRFCKPDCTLNVCGDGALFVGWELCDEGAGNSDAYGSLCGASCEPGARCGDHKLQPEFETCDLGPDNGGRGGDDQGILCDASCKAQRLRGFVTNDGFTGDLGGIFGADLKCRAAAEDAGLAEPQRFYAYLSTGDVDAKDRFLSNKVVAGLPFVFVTGPKFSDDFTALIKSGPLGEGIVVSEHGSTLYEVWVATNTAPGGLRFSPDQHCQGWTSAKPEHVGRVGLSGLPLDSPDAMAWKTKQAWTGALSWPCNKDVFHLYCLEI